MIHRILVAATLIGLTGCGSQQGGVQRLGQKVGETATDFASGVGQGVDGRMEVPVELSEDVAGLGLRKTVAKSLGISPSNRKGITVYFISDKPLDARLVAKAFNAAGEELGRSAVEVEFAADDAKYVTFEFDAQMDAQLVEKYVIETRPPAE